MNSCSEENNIFKSNNACTLLPFTTTYLCKMKFSVLLYIKIKAKNHFNAFDDMHVVLQQKRAPF